MKLAVVNRTVVLKVVLLSLTVAAFSDVSRGQNETDKALLRIKEWRDKAKRQIAEERIDINQRLRLTIRSDFAGDGSFDRFTQKVEKSEGNPILLGLLTSGLNMLGESRYFESMNTAGLQNLLLKLDVGDKSSFMVLEGDVRTERHAMSMKTFLAAILKNESNKLSTTSMSSQASDSQRGKLNISNIETSGKTLRVTITSESNNLISELLDLLIEP
jgi:hypothetical protein